MRPGIGENYEQTGLKQFRVAERRSEIKVGTLVVFPARIDEQVAELNSKPSSAWIMNYRLITAPP